MTRHAPHYWYERWCLCGSTTSHDLATVSESAAQKMVTCKRCITAMGKYPQWLNTLLRRGFVMRRIPERKSKGRKRDPRNLEMWG